MIDPLHLISHQPHLIIVFNLFTCLHYRLQYIYTSLYNMTYTTQTAYTSALSECRRCRLAGQRAWRHLHGRKLSRYIRATLDNGISITTTARVPYGDVTHKIELVRPVE